MKLSDRKWGEFKLDELCSYIKSGNSITEISRKDGITPYISATSLNNGISAFISNKNESIACNVISVNVNGSIGYSFFHKYNAIFSSDCKKLKIKEYSSNEYVSIFICNQIMQQKDKYCYGYKMGKRIAKQIIILPITIQGEPDYQFMEDYIKELMFRKRQEYIKYIKEKLKDLKVEGGGTI